MQDSRSQLFERIRRSLGSAVLPSGHSSVPAGARITPCERGTLVEKFAQELKSAGVQVHLAPNSGDAVDITIHLLRDSCSSREILAWDDSEFPVPELGSALQRAGFARLDADLPADRELRRLRLAKLGQAPAGLTGAQAGLADSGTLVLLSGPKRPRLASLLPPLHIAFLSTRAIHPSMAAYFEAHPKDILQASNLVFVTGPSRTADIEQNLTIGVHGPRELVTIIVGD
jgi:L-lactate dehydrogenase complex protein LldG